MENIHRQVRDAIESGNWEETGRLIRAGAKDFTDDFEYEHDDYPLIFAVIEGRQEDLALLWIDHGYPYYFTGGRDRVTVLHWAARYGMLRLIKKLLSFKNMEINELDGKFHSALWHAAESGQLEAVRLLLEEGADPDGEENPASKVPSDSPLCVAATPEIARLLLDWNADIDFGPYTSSVFHGEAFEPYREYGETIPPLAFHALHGRMNIVRVLLENGGKLGNDALYYMPLGQYEATIDDARELIRLGAEPDGTEGYEPLRVAARAGNAAFCRILLDEGATVFPELLNLAILSQNQDTINLFLEEGEPAEAIRLAARRGTGSILDRLLSLRPGLIGYALLGAIAGCRLGLSRELLAKGADAAFQDKDGNSALTTLYAIDRRIGTYRFIAANPSRYPGEWKYGRFPKRVSEADLERGDMFQLNLSRPDNWNEILGQIERDVMEFAEELIDRGADIRAVDGMRRSALWHACAGSWLESITWLSGLGLNINERDKEDTSCFDAGCLSCESFTIEPMLKVGAVIDAQDGNGDTALIKCGRKVLENPCGFALSCVTKLIERGADADLENNEGVSLRKLAAHDKDFLWHIEFAEKDRES